MTVSYLAKPFPNPGNALELTGEERGLHARHAITPGAVSGCCRKLEMGFFFDGTRNNLLYDEATKAHSNVARLYLAYEHEPRGDELHQYRYRTYIAGVGTEFWKQVGDPGTGLHATAGAAAGWGGEARINWALLQLQNNLHRHWLGSPLTYEDGDLALVKQMSTDVSLQRMQTDPNQKFPQPKSEGDVQERSEVSAQQAFQAIFSTHWRDANTDGRRKVLAARRQELHDKLPPLIRSRLPEIDGIRLYVYGFSRGAAAARVFVNWLRDLCDQPAGAKTICGLPVQVEFLGLFDTVASVGAAQGILDDLATGHGGWAQRRDLRIPDSGTVKGCLHLVAAHEVRGSFPLDLATGANVTEEVFPGVHSDLGGGYTPGEQGRGNGDAEKLSQLPLARMYRASLAAGVPLVDVTSASGPVKSAFEVSPTLVRRFNAYIAEGDQGGSNTQMIMKAQYRLYLRWRRLRLGAHDTLELGPKQDRADILSADRELESEADLLRRLDQVRAARGSVWLRNGYLGMLDELGIGLLRGVVYSAVGGLAAILHPSWRAFDDVPGGYLASVSPAYSGYRALDLLYAQELAAEKKYEMWRQVQPDWDARATLHADIVALFDLHVHDSRAWFKPLGDDDDVWAWKQHNGIKQLLAKERAWNALSPRQQQAARIQRRAIDSTPQPQRLLLELAFRGPGPLTDEEERQLREYRERIRHLGAREGEFPDDMVRTQQEGREVHWLWGYLRWRGMFEDLYHRHASAYPQYASASREQLRSFKRELERQARSQRTVQHRMYQASQRAVVYSGDVWSGGSVSISQEAVRAQADATRAVQETERRLSAVNFFLEELGPEPWWEGRQLPAGFFRR